MSNGFKDKKKAKYPKTETRKDLLKTSKLNRHNLGNEQGRLRHEKKKQAKQWPTQSFNYVTRCIQKVTKRNTMIQITDTSVSCQHSPLCDDLKLCCWRKCFWLPTQPQFNRQEVDASTEAINSTARNNQLGFGSSWNDFNKQIKSRKEERTGLWHGQSEEVKSLKPQSWLWLGRDFCRANVTNRALSKVIIYECNLTAC